MTVVIALWKTALLREREEGTSHTAMTLSRGGSCVLRGGFMPAPRVGSHTMFMGSHLGLGKAAGFYRARSLR